MTDPALKLDHIYQGDCREVLAQLPEGCADLIFADPPYNLQLRQALIRPNLTMVDAVDDSWDRFDDLAGYDQFTREWLTACRRVLSDTGTLWVIGSYHNIYRVGSILQDLGYWFLNDVVWIKCLSGDTQLYALLNDVPIVSSLKDLARLSLDSNPVKLPSYDEQGQFTWVNVIGWQKQAAKQRGKRLLMEDGSHVECSDEHRFPVLCDGEIVYRRADELNEGDVLLTLKQFDLPTTVDSQDMDEAVGAFVGARSAIAAVQQDYRQPYSVWTSHTTRAILEGALRPLRIKAISQGTLREFYEVAVDGNHVFALANGLLTHNSNPMPNFRGVRFTNAHETLLWCKKSRDQKRYTFNYHAMKAANEGKQMRSDWELPLCTGSERLTIDGEKLHATQKPEALLYRILLASTNPGDVVLDPFFGTGTTGVVARRLGRHYIGIEREEKYVRAAGARLDAVAPPLVTDDVVLGRLPSKRSAPRIPFAALLENGLLQPGQMLHFDRQRERTAVVLANGSLRLADGAIGSIHQMGAWISGAPSCNGWEHWYYETPEGELLPLDTLRQQLRQRMESGQE